MTRRRARRDRNRHRRARVPGRDHRLSRGRMRWPCPSGRSTACGAAARRCVEPPPRPASGPPRPGWGGWSTPIGRADRRQGPAAARAASRPIRCACRRRRMRACGVGEPLDLGVRALNTFTDHAAAASAWASSPAPASASRCCCRCWRATPQADVAVIGLVGERGREVQEFLTGRSGRGRHRALGRGGRDLRRGGADAAAGGLPDADARPSISATRASACCA